MLKGHLQIELKNEKTGQVERHEQDNMVTSAVAKVLGLATNSASQSSNNASIYNFLPIAQKALGGIYLFDGKLEENKDNIHFPMDVHLTGCAGRGSDTESSLGGSLNVNETKELDNGYMSVWDFSTAQANGTIASLGLTHYLGGESPFKKARSYALCNVQPGNGSYPIACDSEKGILYYNNAGKIYSQKVFMDIIRVNSPSFGSKELVFNFAFSNPSYSSWTVCNGYDGYLYAIYYPGQSSVGTATIRIRRVKISDFSFTEEDELKFSIDNVMLTASSIPNSSTMFDTYCTVSKGFLYALERYRKELYKINLSNTADIETFTFDKYTAYCVCPMFNGGVFTQFQWNETNSSSGKQESRSMPGVIYPDGEYRFVEKDSSISSDPRNYSYMTIEADNLMTGYYNSGTSAVSIQCMQNYLGTICNLSSPVTKTPEQTMKITYTLTDV